MDERGCRRDIRSNGWIDLSQEFALLENRSGRRNEFSSFGADLQGPQFHRRSLAQVKSGPDVFADALVHRGTPWFPAGAERPAQPFPRSSIIAASDRPGFAARGMPRARSPDTGRCSHRSPCADGYRFAKRQGKPNSADRRKPRRNKHSCNFAAPACAKCLRRIHRDI
jgi:hypothetical protein